MKKLRLSFLAVLVIALLMAAGCSPGGPGQDAKPADDAPSFSAADVQRAAQTVKDSFSSPDASLADLVVDASSHTVYLTMNVLVSSTRQATDAAEGACRQLSDASVREAAQRLADEGSSEEKNSLDGFLTSDNDDLGGGLGVLYDTYGLSIKLDNDADTLDIDGMRQPGAQGAINWQ